MFDLESKKPDQITVNTKKTSVTFNIAENSVDAGLNVGKIQGPGEFEIGDVTIRAIPAEGTSGMNTEEEKAAEAETAAPVKKFSGDTIYDVEVGGVHIGIIGAHEKGLDDLGMSDILCTSSVRAVREVEPKMVIATGNIDGMVTELKVAARTEKKLKIKNRDALPLALEVVALN